MTEEKKWFSVGADAHQENASQGRGQGGGFDPGNINRYYLGKDDLGKENKVLFLDEEPFSAWVHKFEEDRHWGNFETCPKMSGMSEWCPLCMKENKVSTHYYGHYTIIDVTGYTDSEGNHRMPLQILAASNDRVQALKKERKRRNTLVGAMYDVLRTSMEKSSIGNEWVFLDHFDLDEFLNDNREAITYSLNYLPEEYGFYEGDEDSRTYDLSHGLPFEDVLYPKEPEEILSAHNVLNEHDHTPGSVSFGGSSDDGPERSVAEMAQDDFGGEDDSGNVGY